MPANYSLKIIKDEPILINANFNFAYSKAGQITSDFLNRIKELPLFKENLDSVIINTRVHMLMKGQYPDVSCIRASAPFEEDVSKNLERDHFMVFLSNKPNGVCFSEIQGENGLLTIKDGQLIQFTDGTPHRCLETHNSGWRMTMVATKAAYKETIQNKLGHQLPIYLDTINLGW